MPDKTDALSKDDLYLLLESYKNSVEMNTLISQQLSTILDVLQQCKEENAHTIESMKDKIGDVSAIIEKLRDKIDSHNTEEIKAKGNLSGKVNLLYIGIGSIVLGLIWIIYQLMEKIK